jgi:hypothetical protein
VPQPLFQRLGICGAPGGHLREVQACVLLQRQSAHTVLEDMSRPLKVAVCLMCRFLTGLGCQLFTTLPAGPPSNWSPGNKAARLRQPRQRCSDYRCDEALGATCEAARLKGQFACGKCLGHNDDKLRSAGCSAAHNAAFCNNMTCVPSLFGQCKAARSMGGLQCAVCIGKNESLLPTVCTNADEKAFCASKPPRPPPPPSPPLK